MMAEHCRSCGLPQDLDTAIFGCISRASSPAAVKAAIELGLAGGQCFRGSRAEDLPKSEQPGGRSPPETPPPEPPAPRRAAAPGSFEPSAPSISSPPSPQQCSSPSQEGNQSPEILEGARLLDLTPRQYEVLCLMARGAPMKIIARRLGISPATVKAHATLVYRRLDASGREQAVFHARRRGATLGGDN